MTQPITHDAYLDLYMTEPIIQYIYTVEGHHNGAEMVPDSNGKTKTETTYYGITKHSLGDVQKAYADEIPESIKKATVKTLTEEQAKEVAYYNARFLSERISSYMKKNPDAFMNLDVQDRAALLSVFWATGTTNLKKSYDEDSKGSILRVIENNGSKQDIIRALLSKEDGTPMADPKDDGKNGVRNRYYGAVKYMYDEDAGLSDRKTLDEARKRWAKYKTTTNILRCNDEYGQWKRRQNENDATYMNACVANLNTGKKENASEPQTKPVENEPADNISLFTKFTNAMKNLFTNTNGDENGGNENNDLQ